MHLKDRRANLTHQKNQNASKCFNFEKQIMPFPVLSYVTIARFAQLGRLAAARAPRASVSGIQTVLRETTLMRSARIYFSLEIFFFYTFSFDHETWN